MLNPKPRTLNPSWKQCLFLLALLIALGCSGSRRTAKKQTAAPPPSEPATSVEISVIPKQELKEGRPFYQFGTSFAPSSDPAPVAIEPGTFSSDQ